MAQIPEIYGTIFKFLTRDQLIKIVKEKRKYADAALLYYPWDLSEWELCESFSKSDIEVLMKNQNLNRQGLFSCCVVKGLFDKVEILLEDPEVDPSINDNNAIKAAYIEGYDKIVQILLAWTPKLSAKGKRVDPRNIIKYIYSKSNVEAVKLLLAWRGPNGERVDPRDKNNQAIRNASAYGKNKIVRALFAWRGPNGERVDPSDRNNDAIIDASSNGESKVVKLLLAWKGPKGERVDPNSQDGDAILNASHGGYDKIVQAFLTWEGPNGERVDPSTQDNFSIMSASGRGHHKVVKLLANSPQIQYQKNSNVLSQIYNTYKSK